MTLVVLMGIKTRGAIAARLIARGVFPHLGGEIFGFGTQIKRFETWQEHHVQALVKFGDLEVTAAGDKWIDVKLTGGTTKRLAQKPK